jgi:outer membrane lipoprotein SlyB
LPSLLRFCRLAVFVAALAGCTRDYSPNTYSSNAVQQANKVEPAVVVGYRQVAISADGTVGAVTGGAAGGVLGAQAGPGGISSALGAVGGTLVGTIVGTTVERVTGDTTGWEYIVRKSSGDMLSVTQREPTPLAIGQKVLVISGNQARIIPDYSVAVDPPPAAPSGGADRTEKDAKQTPAATGTAAAATPAASAAAAPQTPPAPSAEPAAATAATAAQPVSTPPSAAMATPAELGAAATQPQPVSAPPAAAATPQSAAPAEPSADPAATPSAMTSPPASEPPPALPSSARTSPHDSVVGGGTEQAAPDAPPTDSARY